MRIEIEIPKEFEAHFVEDKFKDSLERVMADIKYSVKSGICGLSGRYEYETIEMLKEALENSTSVCAPSNVDDNEEEISTHSNTDFDKLLGRSPDYEKFPGCGYDRSWCG